MSVARNKARLDIQLYVEIPDDKLAEFSKPGYRPVASSVLMMLLVGAMSASELVQAVEPYVYETRTKICGGNAQLARHVGEDGV